LANDIVQAAASLVEERGPENITMRLVADRIGYSATTIYLYFKNKEQLLDAIVMYAFDVFADSVERSQREGLPDQRIRAAAHAYLEWGINNPGMYRLMFEWGYLGDISEEGVFARRTTWRRIRQLVELGMQQGLYRPEIDSHSATDAMWAGIHGLTSLTISGRMFGDPENVDHAVIGTRAHALVDALVDSWIDAWRVCS
jgi:AcrR family transcriptional regulator